MGVSGLSWGHRRSTWGSLNLGSPGAAVDSAHWRPVIFLGCLSHFSSYPLLFFGFLTYLRLALWGPAFSVTASEVSTGDPVVGDVPRCSRVVFSQICSSPSGFYASEASTEVAGTFCCSPWGFCWTHCCQRRFRSLKSLRSSNFPFFSYSKEAYKVL